MLSDKIPERKALKKRQEGHRTWYPDQTKIDCVKLWLVTGNLMAVSAAQKIPYATLQTWRYSDWWSELAADIRTEGQLTLSNRLKQVAERAMEVTLDRLENGDWILDQKTGKMIRKPVVMRDAHRVAESFIDRAERLDKKPHTEAHDKKVEDRLAQLAASFAQFAHKAKRIEVIDIEVEDALQIEGPSTLDVLQEAGDGEGMGSPHSEYEDSAGEETELYSEETLDESLQEPQTPHQTQARNQS